MWYRAVLFLMFWLKHTFKFSWLLPWELLFYFLFFTSCWFFNVISLMDLKWSSLSVSRVHVRRNATFLLSKRSEADLHESQMFRLEPVGWSLSLKPQETLLTWRKYLVRDVAIKRSEELNRVRLLSQNNISTEEDSLVGGAVRRSRGGDKLTSYWLLFISHRDD